MMGDTYRVQTKMHTDDILAQIDAQLAGRPYSDLFTREEVFINWTPAVASPGYVACSR